MSKSPFRQAAAFLFAAFTILMVFSHLSGAIPPTGHPVKKGAFSTSQQRLDAQKLADIAQKLKQSFLPSGSAGKTAVNQSSQLDFPKDANNGTPIFLDRELISHMHPGAAKKQAGASPEGIALDFIQTNREIFKLNNPQEELKTFSLTQTEDGFYHISFNQVYEGVTVWEHRLVVHLDRDQIPYAMNGRYSPTPQGIDVHDVPVNMARAIEEALLELSSRTTVLPPEGWGKILGYTGPSAQLVIWVDDATGQSLLAWQVTIRPSLRERWFTFVDARTGKILESYNAATSSTPSTANAVDALGKTRTLNVTLDQGVYYLEDSTAKIQTYSANGKVISATTQPVPYSSTDNTWTDSLAVSAHANARVTYDFYLTKENRNGLDAKNGEIHLIMHYTDNGQPLDNAFWAGGGVLAFGDAEPFTRAQDVVAHEMTHGVVEYTVGLNYKNQPGALNEAIADVMACMVDPNWQVGETLPKGPIRDLLNPSKYNMPADMSGYKTFPLSQDEGGVHYNMSIPSRAWALLGESIGRDKTANILYRVLNSRYLAPEAQFTDMRLAAVQSATDLFGAASNEVSAVKQSFTQVGILDAAPTQPPVDTTPIAGNNIIAFVDDYQNLNNLLLGKTVIQTAPDISRPTLTMVYTGTASPLTVSSDGSKLIFVDSSNNLRMIKIDTYQELLIDSTGQWSSLALSPDGNTLAATTVNSDSTIYILDLNNPGKSRAILLYTPGTEGIKNYTTVEADKLEWDSTGTQVLYDAFHQIPVTGGNPLEFWDINILDVKSGIIARVNTPTGSGTQVGNPSYAQTNDRYIVCDMFQNTAGKYSNSITAIDLYLQTTSTLHVNGVVSTSSGPFPNLGFARYSPDDKTVIYQRYSQTTGYNTLYKLSLKDDKMTPSGTETSYHRGSLPVWFVRGNITSVDETTIASPVPFALRQNYPNPFNPGTSIAYTLYKPGKVTLTVFNLLGQAVGTLVDGYKAAGEYRVNFNGLSLASGIYLYRLQYGKFSETRQMLMVK
ncbi:MAG: M4 family metallopeptidase [Candidatus Latescibacter sp.]|nr:M4 family metallopeptidase [Candidatus Latescibacter sp.]